MPYFFCHTLRDDYAWKLYGIYHEYDMNIIPLITHMLKTWNTVRNTFGKIIGAFILYTHSRNHNSSHLIYLYFIRLDEVVSINSKNI